jgi:iron(III) transport system permease protein
VSRHPDQPVRLWLAAGLLAYLVLPWYAIQDTAWYTVLGQVLGGAPRRPAVWYRSCHTTASGCSWACWGWLWRPLAWPYHRARRKVAGFLAGGVLGFGGLLASGFMIGAKGWSFEILNRGFGELALNQFGIGHRRPLWLCWRW